MANDAVKQTLLDVEIINGEQPDGTKLTQAFAQLKTSIQSLNKIIGDLLGQQTHKNGAGASYSLETSQPVVGPNITRALGSTGKLNPRRPGRVRVTNHEVVFAGHSATLASPTQVDGITYYNRRIFILPFWPILITSTEGDENFQYQTSVTAGQLSIGSPGGTYTDATIGGSPKVDPSGRVSSIGDLNATGEWHISEDGVITLYSGLDANEGFKVTYTFDAIPDAYDGAYFNVYPDFSQTSTLCTVAAVGGSTDFDITLPSATEIRNADLSANTNEHNGGVNVWVSTAGASDPMDAVQLTLPKELTSNLSSGDTIPDGYIKIYDENSGSVLSGGTFTYRSTTTVRVSGLSLSASTTRYRLIVGGTGISDTLAQVKDSMYYHDHSGSIHRYNGHVFMGNRIRHDQLLYLFDEGDGSTYADGFVPSAIGAIRNPHPQYLHRYGYKYSNNSTNDDRNVHNAMLGPLIFSNINKGLDLTTDSESIIFGDSSNGPEMYYRQSDSKFRIRGKDVLVDELFTAIGGVASGNTNTSYDQLKWVRFYGTLDTTGAGGSPTVISTTPKPSDMTFIVGASVACRDYGALTVWYPSISVDEGAASSYLAVQLISTAASNLAITLVHSASFDGYQVLGVIFYI